MATKSGFFVCSLASLAAVACATQSPLDERRVDVGSATRGDDNYDHLIVAGERIGPIHAGLAESEATNRLGSIKDVWLTPGGRSRF